MMYLLIAGFTSLDREIEKSDRIRHSTPATGLIIMNLVVGQSAPDFTLIATGGRTIHLGALQGKNVVLAFFPMAWTPI